VPAIVVLAALAAYFIVVEMHKPGLNGFDVYGHFLPMKIYAVESLFAGGKGLLWIPFQSCGQPFFANPATSLLYPPHLLFLVLEANVAVHVVLGLNMMLGGLGAFLLLREMDVRWIGALAGALAFELGDPMSQLTGWGPMQNGSWTWVPWALLMCERVLRAPTRGRVIGLAATLGLMVLPGWMLIAALTYQLIALRVTWELLTRREPGVLRAAVAVGIGLALMPLLVAVQLMPAAEFANETFRVGIEKDVFSQYGGMPVKQMLSMIKIRQPPVPFTVALLALAAVALLSTPQRRRAVFWTAIAPAYAVLALGPATPLYRLYAMLPPGPALIRYAHRLFFLTGFSLAVLTGLAIDAVGDQRVPRRRLWISLAVVAAIAAALFWLTPGGLRRVELIAFAIVIVAYAAALAPSLRAPAAGMAAAAVLFNLVAVPLRYVGALLPSIDGYWHFEKSLTTVRSWQTAQDRVLLHPSVPSSLNLSLLTKTASIMRLKDPYDYDALLTQRMVEFESVLYHGEVLYRPSDVFSPKAKKDLRARMLNVAAIRHVLTVPGTNIVPPELGLRRLALPDAGIEGYANDTALPRARFVPRLAVVHDPTALLRQLAYGTDDLAEQALVENPLPSGFQGEADVSARGTATFVRDDPEHLIIDVDAPARGFLVVADQYFPGWRATVNGDAAPIVRANFAFRLVEVPSGRSRVELRYRPASVYIGAAISVTTIVAVIATLRLGRRRR
jgi:hypothetical protein